jgi:hypothetical protein
VDQAAPPNQVFLWHQRERCEDPNLDRRVGLCARRYRPEALGLELSLYQILQILSVMLFEKTPILQALQPPDSQKRIVQFRQSTDSV